MTNLEVGPRFAEIFLNLWAIARAHKSEAQSFKKLAPDFCIQVV